MPPIHVLIKPSSGMCNMTCDYCFYCDEMGKREQKNYGFMSEETLKNVIRKTMLQAEGSITYAFQGGEPTLRGLDFFQKVIEFEKQYNRNGIKVHNVLQTNGYAIDVNWCRFFKKNNFLIGVSVDGTKEIHDAYRHSREGKPTFERIVQTTGLLDAYGVDYNILTVVTQEVTCHIADIYEFYKKQGWQYQQYIVCLEPLDETHGKNGYAPTPKQYGQFLIDLFDLWYTDLKHKKQPFIRQFENYIAVLLGYMPESCDQRGICGIQNVVEADGSVYPCDFYMLDEYRLGNFNENRLEDINRTRNEIGFIQRSQNRSETCNSCQYDKVCRGGCQRNRDFNPETGCFDNYFCTSYRMFFDRCLDKMQEIANMVGKSRGENL